MVLGIFLALGSAASFGLSSALQQRAAKQERPRMALDPRLLGTLLRRPLWLFSWVPDASGIGLQTAALHFGALALVQPILVSGLFLAIPLEAVLDRRRPHPRDLVAVAIGSIGLAAFLITAQPRAGVSQPSALAWLGVGIGAAVLVTPCLVLARRPQDARRGVLLGLATGVLYAVAAALIKTVTDDFTRDKLGAFANWHVYALVVVGLAGLLLNQNAFQGGPIAAPLTALTLVDPVVSVIVAVTAFREKLDIGDARLAIEAFALLVMAVGIWLASTTRAGR